MTEKFTRLVGLDWLEGQEVVVIGDGTLAATGIVLNGEIDLDFPVTKGWVGLPYQAHMRTLQQNGGQGPVPAQTTSQRMDKIAISYMDTVAGKFAYPDAQDADWQVFASRTEEDFLGDNVTPRKGVRHAISGAGWQSNQIDIKSTPGFPMTILKVAGRMNSNG